MCDTILAIFTGFGGGSLGSAGISLNHQRIAHRISQQKQLILCAIIALPGEKVFSSGMGNNIDCACLAHGFLAGGDEKASRDRIELLQKGQKFLKKTMMGLSTQEIFVKLSEDTSSIEWRIEATRLSKEEFGEIDLTTKVKCIKLTGTAGLQVIALEGDKSLLEVHAEDVAVRDKWALSLNELLQIWEGDPEKKPNYTATAAKTSKKDAYFKQREEELAERIKSNEEKKKKYATGGMQYTAIAMMNRS